MENKQNIKDLVQKFYPYAKNALGFEHPVRVIMRHDAENEWWRHGEEKKRQKENQVKEEEIVYGYIGNNNI